VLLVSACATVDFDAPKSPSYANVDTSDTTLGRAAGAERKARHPQAGFYPLIAGIDALSARLLLIERAEKTLDVQYYLWGDDAIGDLFFDRLLAAADRGVRVRLLIDDIGTRGIEGKLAPVDAHPNIELRVFNPFASRGVRLFDAWDGYRLNRRMHNKSLTADNEVSIMGGRNIAAEYYAANPAYNFGDFDVAAIGSVVPEVSAMFDRYWNDRYAVPYAQLSSVVTDDAAQQAMRAALSESVASLTNSPYRDVVASQVEEFRFTRADDYFWAPYALVYDAPEKVRSNDTPPEARITTSLKTVAEAAESELLVVSPYFVPRKAGIQWLTGIAQQGVQIDVLTNGLASNDHLPVYGGYAPVRKPLLREGVRFYEVRGDLVLEGTRESGAEDARSKLHGKSFIVDRSYVFIGSFNWDPRSANLNTEMGVVIRSPELGAAMAEGIYRSLNTNAYAVTLDEQGALQWQTTAGGEQRVFDKEPESNWWLRFVANVTRLLPIRGLL